MAFFSDLFDRAGLDAASYRQTALSRRIPACLRLLRVPNLDAARSKLLQRPDLVEEVIDVLLLGVTDFCRDPAVFDHLQSNVVPELARLQRPPRVWSAACSDGRELYSIAILLQEAGVTDPDMLGTDCRAAAIRMARAGDFPGEALDNLSPEWKKHFVAFGSRVRVETCLKRSIRWKQADLLTAQEPGLWDMILWRNMAIYLNPQVAEGIWNILIQELAPGGFLVSGKADHPPRHAAMKRIAPGIYQKSPSPDAIESSAWQEPMTTPASS